MVGIHAAARDPAGELGKLPTRLEFDVQIEGRRGAEGNERAEIAVQLPADQVDQIGGKAAGRPETGALRGGINATLQLKRFVQDLGGQFDLQGREPAGGANHQRSGVDSGAADPLRRRFNPAVIVMSQVGLQAAVDEGPHAPGPEFVRHFQPVDRELDPGGRGRVAQQGQAGGGAKAGGRECTGRGQFHPGGEQFDVNDRAAGLGGGEYQVQGGGLEHGQLVGDGNELPADHGVVAHEEFRDRWQRGAALAHGGGLPAAVRGDVQGGHTAGELRELIPLRAGDEGEVEVVHQRFAATRGREHGRDVQARARDLQLPGFDAADHQRPGIEGEINRSGADDRFAERGQEHAGLFDEHATRGVETGAAELRAHARGRKALLE